MLAISPGPATAMVIHSAARAGRRTAILATAGNAAGLALWAIASMFGAAVLMWLGIQAVRRSRKPQDAPQMRPGRPFSRGVVTALANPKVGLFYVALLPQFVPDGAPLLPTT